jgi:hypothetical protein
MELRHRILQECWAGAFDLDVKASEDVEPRVHGAAEGEEEASVVAESDEAVKLGGDDVGEEVGDGGEGGGRIGGSRVRRRRERRGRRGMSGRVGRQREGGRRIRRKGGGRGGGGGGRRRK